MAKGDHTRAACAVKTQQRQLTVKRGFYAYQSKYDYKEQTEIAEILLKGNWLAKAGFQAGQAVTVRVMQGCLVLTRKESP
ncbi:MAG: type I addiction module toxin, SymE family [Gammaproteobacteria bacterium]|nr:type I addiction module toxin, SymE family [Gammaproteobacteria bacterium]